MTTEMVLVFPIRETESGVAEVLLGLKVIGINAGCRNGFGGKVEAGESSRRAAARELWAEAGLVVDVADLELVGVLNTEEPDSSRLIAVFKAHDYTGEPRESDEMKDLQWFPISELPLGQMAPSDRFWLPRTLQGQAVSAELHFDRSGTLTGYQILPLSDFEVGLQ